MKKTVILFMIALLILGSSPYVKASEITSTEEKDTTTEENTTIEETTTEDTETVEPLIVVLDPGHDKTHGGARGNDLSETALNLKIAQYCYEELSKYSNVQVYMTRTTSECPHPETCGKTEGARMDNLKRVDFAKHLQADVYVALHLNSYSDSSIHGAMVFVPNNNYRPEIGREGWALGNAIQKELVALGLKDQGLSTRGSEDGTRYEDGSLADYYGVIKRAKDWNIPGIIVEHCFISSPHDVSNFLSTEAKLKELGVADATGIAKYYGLEKTGETTAPDPIHKVEFIKDGKLVYTEYVRHGQDAWVLDEELISAVNITYSRSLSNITKDTTITVDYDPVDLSAPKPDTETEPENSEIEETESGDISDTETEGEEATETEITETDTTESVESETGDVTEIMENPNRSGKVSLRDVLIYGAGLVSGLVIGCLVGLCWKKKKQISKEE